MTEIHYLNVTVVTEDTVLYRVGNRCKWITRIFGDLNESIFFDTCADELQLGHLALHELFCIK